MSGLPTLHRRLSEKLPGWQAIGADPTTLKWIKHGVPVEFLGGKPPTPFVMHELPVSEHESKWWLTKEAPCLIALGVLSELPVGAVLRCQITSLTPFVCPSLSQETSGWWPTCAASMLHVGGTRARTKP